MNAIDWVWLVLGLGCFASAALVWKRPLSRLVQCLLMIGLGVRLLTMITP